MIQHVDISHFRAPYKNWPVAFGQEGATVATTTAPAAPSIIITKEGVRHVAPNAVPTIMEMLKQLSTVFLDNNSVKLDVRVPNDPRPSAFDWAQGKLKEGLSVVIGSTAGAEMVAAPVAGVLTLMAVKGAEGEAAVAGGNTLPFTAVLAQPTALAKAGIGGLALVGIGVVAVALIGAAMAKKKRTAVPNRRRR